MSGEGTSLAIQWLRHCTSEAGGVGLIPDPGAKISHAVSHGQIKINQLIQLKNKKEGVENIAKHSLKKKLRRGRMNTGTNYPSLPHILWLPGLELSPLLASAFKNEPYLISEWIAFLGYYLFAVANPVIPRWIWEFQGVDTGIFIWQTPSASQITRHKYRWYTDYRHDRGHMLKY